MVADGETATLVPVTAPIPLMDRLVAPLTDQDRVLLWPRVRLVGDAEKDAMEGFVMTVMVTEAVDVL